MDPDLFKAAAKGNTEPFKKLKDQHVQLDKLVTTKLRDTILQINIKSQDRTGVSTEFAAQILEMCPSLLLQVNEEADTPLHVAAKCGHSAIVKLLIERAKSQKKEIESGLRPEWEMLKMTNNDKNSALHEAVQRGNIGVVEILTKEGDPDFSYSANNLGETPLYLAAAGRYDMMVIRILESCTSAAHEGPNGKTALHEAVFKWHTIKSILEKKKNLTNDTDQHGWTPLHYAAYYGTFFTVKELLKSDISVAYNGDKERKMTPLHMAASQGYVDVIRDIISACPECYELEDNRGWNVLHFAKVSLREEKLENLLKIPLIESLLLKKDAKGNTPLHVLAATHHKFQLEVPLGYSIPPLRRGYMHAVNNQNINVASIFKYGHSELEHEIQELSKDVGKGQQYPAGVICIRENDKFFPMNDIYKEIGESHLLVSTLIATVTFSAAFTFPGGYNSKKGPNQGTAILSKNSAFQAFIVTDTMAMTLSLAAVFIHFFLSFKGIRESERMESERMELAEKLITTATLLTIFAMGAMVVAFITGTYAVLAPSLGLAVTTCFIGLSFFLIAFCQCRSMVKEALQD